MSKVDVARPATEYLFVCPKMPGEPIHVRLAQANDLEFVCADGQVPAAMVSQLIEQRRVYLATQNGVALGYARIEYLWSKLPYISLIIVLEQFRRRGVGRALLVRIEQDARRAGHAYLYSSSQADEPSPQAWHRHMGFVECGYIAGINAGGAGEVFFRKPLGHAT